MRAYFIRLTAPETSPDSGNVRAFWTSFNPDGSTNGSALQVEFDIPTYAYGDPAGNAYVKISGVELSQLQSTNNFNDCDITIYGGMAKGLPLANPAQAGILLKGQVLQAFGNWQGNQVTLEFMVIPKAGTVDKPVNLSYTWRKGTTLQDAVTQTLKIAYPGAVIKGGFASSLVYTEDVPFAYQTLQQFAQFVLSKSKDINPNPAYPGARFAQTPDGFSLSDDSAPPAAKEISFLNLIGQPTWLSPGTMQFKTVMRADLNIFDRITMPKGTNAIETQEGYSRYRNATAFQGEFGITNIRHLGNSRQPSADSWVSIFNVYAV